MPGREAMRCARWLLPVIFLTIAATSARADESEFGPAMKDQLTVRWPTGTKDLAIALGWHVYTQYGTELVWHDGGTYGYCSFVGFVSADILSQASVALTLTLQLLLQRGLLEKRATEKAFCLLSPKSVASLFLLNEITCLFLFTVRSDHFCNRTHWCDLSP